MLNYRKFLPVFFHSVNTRYMKGHLPILNRNAILLKYAGFNIYYFLRN